MQSTSPTPRPLDPLDVQHNALHLQSPNRTPPLSMSQSHTPTPQNLLRQHTSSMIPCDTTPTFVLSRSPPASSKPTTPPTSAFQSPPLTPPSTLTTSISSALSLSSTLSASAPQFQTRLLDAPIDIHQLPLAPGTNDSPADPLESALKPKTLTGSAPTMIHDVLDISLGAALLNEGPTPTQETYSLKQSANIPGASPSVASSPFVPDRSAPLAVDGQSDMTDDARTPNVYINGLPPNYPEEQLLAMTSEFGEVISVRTFTRHVSDKPSGYGFVLFGSVDAAGKCIETLRKYRNLHPSFSKRIHKIPGTAYNSVTPDSSLSLASMDSDSELTSSDSFKARMERLKDTASTNLYMEGLPMSIDERTLDALVRPYKIMSSRFFQTRLSNPPRIIAFVRLESRTAAEEVIERLHGRMVRGWRDAGCRISVRFADTTEQRELRRTERMGRDGEQSPARLTVAQAALLNLKGAQLQGQTLTPPIASPNFGLSPTFNSNLSLSPDPTFARLNLGNALPTIGLQHVDQHYVHSHHAQDLSTPFTPALLGTLGAQYDELNAQAAEFNVRTPALRMPPHMMGYGADVDVMPQLPMSGGGIGGGVATRAQDGFTPVERLILQAHVQRQQEAAQLAALSGNRSQGTFGLKSGLTVNGSTALGKASANGRRLANHLPLLSEEDFHSGAAQRQLQRSRDGGILGHGGNQNGLNKAQSQPPTRLTLDDISARLSFTRQRNQTHASDVRAQANAQAQAQAIHARSTTLPSHYMSVDRSGDEGFLSGRSGGVLCNTTNSTSMNTDIQDRNITLNNSKNISYGTTSMNNFIRGNNSCITTSNTDSTRDNNSRLFASNSSISISNSNSNSNPTSKNTFAQSNNIHSHVDTNTHAGVTSNNSSPRTNQQQQDHDDGSNSPLDSPALTHSTARTPTTLSPSTPFSAFPETFEGPPVTVSVPTVTVGGGAGEVGLGMGMSVGMGASNEKAQLGSQ